MTMTDANMPATGETPVKPSIFKVIKDQRKIIGVALAMIVASFWVAGQFGEWQLAGCISAGVVLGLANHLHTEWWLLKIISSGAEPTKGQITRATIARLTVLSVVAIGIAIAFWPDGIGLLIGLAIFRLIALVMTTIPLLKELKNQ